MKFSFFKFFVFGMACIASISLQADEIVVRTPTGDSLTVEVDPNATFKDVMELIEINLSNEDSYIVNCSSSPYIVDFMVGGIPHVLAGAGQTRVYSRPTTQSEKNDIRYIVTTLAKNSWAQILTSQSSLNHAGDRIDSVHPLKFLTCVFTDEELKGGVHSIRDRKLIWNNFFEGLEESLQEESNKGNMKPEFIQDFAKNVGINPALVTPAITNRQWTSLMDTLLKNLPRKGDPGRYDM